MFIQMDCKFCAMGFMILFSVSEILFCDICPTLSYTRFTILIRKGVLKDIHIHKRPFLFDEYKYQ